LNARTLAKLLAFVAVPVTAFAVAPYFIPPRRRKLHHGHELALSDDQFINLDGFNMRYQVKGEPGGMPLILIHGFASSVVTWYRNMDDLARDHRVYAIDLKGWGLTDKPSHGDYSMRGQAHHVRTFMHVLGIERALIVGHSMGGAIAVHMAAEFPEAVAGIVLIDPAGARPFPYLWLLSRMMDVPPVRQWIHVGAQYVIANERLLTSQMPRAYHNPDNLTHEMKRALVQPYHTHGFIDALINLTRDTRHFRLNGQAAQVNCPALIIWGEQDRVVPPSDGQYFLREIRDSRLEILPEAGHLPHEERAEEVNRLIREFIMRLS
jgi:pimeloyl-ACP methyl ester carboxylesterase